MNKIEVFGFKNEFKKLEKPVKTIIQGALEFLKKKNIYLEVYLVSDQKMRLLNKKFRGKGKATNVLSFREPRYVPHPEHRITPLGELYLAPDYIRGHKEEFSSIIIHGLLHLFGYTHSTRNGRIKMERKERELLSNV